jgi:hypothetical protein
MQGPQRKSAFRQFQDARDEVVGRTKFDVPTLVESAVGMIPQLAMDENQAMPGLGEAMNISRRIAKPLTAPEYRDNPWRRRLMVAAGAVPFLGEPLQGMLTPSFVASERFPTPEERSRAVGGTVALGSLAAAKTKGSGIAEGGDWGGLDPTRGVRTSLSTETAPKIGRNLLKPKNSQMQFGADPGEFVVGMKTEAGKGVASYGPQIDAKLKALNTQADQIAFNTPEGRTVPIDYEGSLRGAFQKHIQEALRDGNSQMAMRLQSVLENEIQALRDATGTTEIINGKEVFVPGQGVAPARVGRRYHQDLGNQVGRFQKAGRAGVADPADGTINAARQDAWVAIKQQTSEAVPQLRDVNEQLHSGIEARKALFERELTESKADPLWWVRHPVAATVAAVPMAATSPYVRSRLASAMRSLAPVEQAPAPDILPNESVPWRAGVRRPANEQRALPSAPENAPEGFISSDDLRMVGTRLGQVPGQDAAVFSPQVATSGMAPPDIAPTPQPVAPDWMTALKARRESPLTDMAASSDFRDLSRTMGAVRDADYASGSAQGRLSPSPQMMPEWLTKLTEIRLGRTPPAAPSARIAPAPISPADAAIKSVADRYFGGNIEAATQYLRDRGAL